MTNRKPLFESPRETLRHEHAMLGRLCDDLVNRAESDDWRTCDAVWNELGRALEAHLSLEEATFLPVYGAEGPEQAYLVDQLRGEHHDIRLAVERLGAAIQVHALRASDAREFVETLRRHAALEDATLYAWADRAIKSSAKSALVTPRPTAPVERSESVLRPGGAPERSRTAAPPHRRTAAPPHRRTAAPPHRRTAAPPSTSPQAPRSNPCARRGRRRGLACHSSESSCRAQRRPGRALTATARSGSSIIALLSPLSSNAGPRSGRADSPPSCESMALTAAAHRFLTKTRTRPVRRIGVNLLLPRCRFGFVSYRASSSRRFLSRRTKPYTNKPGIGYGRGATHTIARAE
ncbi:MAG: hemerythrin domain-containing protein [Polyangiaceae bacterium]|nr:hemerythrin domain-containing protein [Polyangiaceae bacterium]